MLRICSAASGEPLASWPRGEFEQKAVKTLKEALTKQTGAQSWQRKLGCRWLNLVKFEVCEAWFETMLRNKQLKHRKQQLKHIQNKKLKLCLRSGGATRFQQRLYGEDGRERLDTDLVAEGDALTRMANHGLIVMDYPCISKCYLKA